MRIGDAEREIAIDELRAHAAAGRLDHVELEQRIEAAFAARTNEDLAELERDLPQRTETDTGFGEHLRVFLAIQALLVAIWAVTGMGYFWPVWPFMGWGIALVLHGVCAPGTPHSWASGSKRARRRKAIAS